MDAGPQRVADSFTVWFSIGYSFTDLEFRVISISLKFTLSPY